MSHLRFCSVYYCSRSILLLAKDCSGGTAASHTCSGVGGGLFTRGTGGKQPRFESSASSQKPPRLVNLYYSLITRLLSCPKACRHGRRDGGGLFRSRSNFDSGHLWYGERNAVSNAIGYAMHYSRSHDAVIRVYDE